MNKNLWQAGCLAAALGMAGMGQAAWGQATSIASGDWAANSTWDINMPPDAGTPAYINGGHTLTSSGNAEMNILDIGTAAGGSGTVNVTGGQFVVVDSGTEPNLPSIRLGQVEGSTGTMNVSGGDVYVDGGVGSGFAIGEIMVGDNGAGELTVTGGTVTSADEMFIAFGGNSTGTVNVSGGTLAVAGRNMLLGWDGDAQLNLSGTGEIQIAEFFFSSFWPVATSTVSQTGGTLSIGHAFVHGRSGNATYNHSAGAINVAAGPNGDFVVGDGGLNNVYNISGSATVTNGRHFMVGVFDGAQGTVNQTGGSIQVGDLVRIGVDGNGTYNHSAGELAVTGSMFLGDFDSSLGVYEISGGTLDISGNLNVGGALASNAPPAETRLEPSEANGPQGQALDANGTFIVNGNGGNISVAGNLLANPDDKAVVRNGPGQENDSVLKFTLGTAGVSTIDIGGIADLDGAIIDIDDAAGYFTANPSASLTLIDAASGFGNVFTVTAAEAAGNGRGFSLAAGDVGAFELAIEASGAGEKLVLTKGAGGGLAADFNDDGFVDGLDLAAWKAGFGPTNAADANNDGVTDGADFLVWQREFTGAGASPVATAVPEPASLALAGAALAIAAASRRRL